MDPTFLEDLREQANMSPTQVLKAVKELAPEIAPTKPSGIIHWEQQGIYDFRVIDALKQVYSVDEEIVKQASLASKLRFQSRQRDNSLLK